MDEQEFERDEQLLEARRLKRLHEREKRNGESNEEERT